ncbi:MAG TPA: metal-dependent hydrolase [Anaerolineales bacterium]|nr:metal-dependent hydrolase [Anaerolineales bacterium]
MPSPIVHLTAGYAIYRLSKHNLPERERQLLKIPIALLIIAGLSILPDLDFMVGLLLGDIEKYHNNISHSLLVGLPVALLAASLMVLWSRSSRFWVWFAVSLAAYDLHPILDLFAGERGVMLFWPIVQDRFTSPVKLFYGVQWGLGLISPWHFVTILSELLFLIIVYFLIAWLDKRKPARL